ncbi:MAG: IpaD/SipD/SspD family type III secretion system needle tip protein [Candidatus Malihini olakiniferum]
MKEKSSSSTLNEHVDSALEDLKGASALAYDGIISYTIDYFWFDTFSSRKINKLVSNAINSISERYLDVFQQAVEKNALFYKDFYDFMSSLPQLI